MKKGLKLIGLLYLFILGIEIIKKASIILAPNIKELLIYASSPIKAICTGWITTCILQSSGIVGSIVATFTGNNILPLQTGIFILMGGALGTGITTFIFSIIYANKKRRDFRHGFEIGLCYSIYSFLLVFVVFGLEYFFKIFSKTSLFLAILIENKIPLLKVPNAVEIITNPITQILITYLNKIILFIFGFLILIFAMKFISGAIIEVIGGEEKAKRFISKYFKSKYKGYLIGFFLTAIVFSSSITIGLLVPLAVSRLINLKKAIPFILGAALGTFSDLFLVAILIGTAPAIAIAISFFLFALTGTILFLPNTDFLFEITKYVSKKAMHISKKKAIIVLIIFILIPITILLI